MNFENLNQAVASIQMLQKFYSILRILDGNTNEILYSSEDSRIPHETPASFSGCYNVVLSISENDHLINVTITIPISIGNHSCYLELIQYIKRHENITSPIFTKQEVILNHIQKLAMTDSLTNLYNRRYIDKQFPVDLARTFQNNEPVSVIYADIDYFKRINDKYGHIAGDYVLKEIAGIFRHHLGEKSGWIARYGGDEIFICLPKTNKAAAVRIANRIRSGIEAQSFYIKSQYLKITCSFGVATLYKRNGINTVNKALELVDKKLYQAKKKGRNRVIV
ncbi:diguanylate cyclase [Mobilisporobacter senegalensis]|uniref:Diguanylate cyclase n=1 Tax=Mobilisporobacter senegalensis TaxID=1329262 RepID=A0A3N1XB16_9FIRM|nr:GGDEF domain-containing protein [Mobilisporobacter senegalensis]ROR23959.1 diguanylate cyclase [Mobilisporobacter senegalensis]